MGTIIDGLRQVIGEANFYNTDSGYSGSWDYGAMIEYFVAALIVCIVITSVFKIISRIFK